MEHIELNTIIGSSSITVPVYLEYPTKLQDFMLKLNKGLCGSEVVPRDYENLSIPEFHHKWSKAHENLHNVYQVTIAFDVTDEGTLCNFRVEDTSCG